MVTFLQHRVFPLRGANGSVCERFSRLEPKDDILLMPSSSSEPVSLVDTAMTVGGTDISHFETSSSDVSDLLMLVAKPPDAPSAVVRRDEPVRVISVALLADGVIEGIGCEHMHGRYLKKDPSSVSTWLLAEVLGSCPSAAATTSPSCSFDWGVFGLVEIKHD